MTTLTQTTALKAWNLATEFDWEEDKRFQDVHEALCAYYLYYKDLEDCLPDLKEVFQMTVEEIFNVTFDIDDLSEIDIADELDDLGRGNYAALPEIDEEEDEAQEVVETAQEPEKLAALHRSVFQLYDQEDAGTITYEEMCEAVDKIELKIKSFTSA